MIANAWTAVQPEDFFRWLASAGITMWLFNEGKKLFAHKDVVGRLEFTKFEKYVHDANHDIRNDLNAVALKGQNRDEVLAKLEERSIAQSLQLRDINSKIDRLISTNGRKRNTDE